MLVLKKISTKKLSIYLSIIVLMLGGTGFMLYQNQKLTSKRSVVFSDPAQFEKFMDAGAVLPGGGAAPDQTPAEALKTIATSSQPIMTGRLKINQGIDTTIFSKEKFKALKENPDLNQAESELGKRDPFQPN